MQGQLPLILRLVWFVLVGWGLGLMMVTGGYLLCLTVVGMPLGIWVLHRVPLVMTLKLDGVRETATGEEIVIGNKVYRAHRAPVEAEQWNFLLRTIWFLAVGWWLTFLWLKVAYILTVLILPLPLAFWMYNRVPVVLTLEQS